MRIIETKIFTIDEHPNPDKCYDWMRNNLHDLNDWGVHELIESIKALSEKIGGSFDYSISAVPDRGEYIKFKDYDKEKLKALNSDNCPLTGVCWDVDLINGLKDDEPSRILNTLHEDTEYIYSDEGLKEHCQANEYEFDKNGKLI